MNHDAPRSRNDFLFFNFKDYCYKHYRSVKRLLMLQLYNAFKIADDRDCKMHYIAQGLRGYRLQVFSLASFILAILST